MKYFYLLLAFFLLNVVETQSQCVNDLYLGFGGSANDEGKAVVTDQAGNAYIAGTFINAIQLGAFSLTTNDSLALFLEKLSPVGNVVWAKTIITKFSTFYNTILKINAAGQLVMAGTCDNQTSDFDTLSQPFNHKDIYVAKFDPADGTLQDFVSMGNHGYSWVNDLDTDSDNNIYVTGGFVGPVSFGPFNMQCLGTTNTFIAMFNANSQASWAMRVPNNLTSGNFGNKINFDGGQHIYVSGWYGLSCDFGNGNVLSSNDYSNGYLSKLDTAGNVIWAKTSIPGQNYFHQAVIDSTSIIVVSESPATLVNYNKNGDTLWTRTISNNSYNLFRQMICFKEHLFTLGSFNNSILLGDSTCNIAGNNIFIARFGLDGTFDWLKPVHSTYNAFTTSFDIDTSGNFHVIGAYQGSDTLDFTHAMPVIGGREALYIRLCNGAVSLNDLKNVPDLKVFPVPFINELVISGTEKNGEISIFDVTGREILKFMAEKGETEISTSDFHSGLYLVRYFSGDRSFSRIVLKN